MEKIRNYNQESEEEILENKQETLSEKESRLENIEIEQFEGEKLEAPKNYFQYLQEMSPIIKAIENTITKIDREKSIEVSIENLQESTQEIIEFYQDLQEQLKSLDKENNPESDYNSLIESDNLKDNLFFLKNIDKEKTMDFFQSTSHLNREERDSLIKNLKNIKVFQEFKEKVQSIALLMIDKIEEIEESYKLINPTSIEKQNVWDTDDLVKNRRFIKLNIDNELEKLNAIKVSLIYEIDLPKDSIQEDSIDSKLSYTIEKLNLPNDLIEKQVVINRFNKYDNKEIYKDDKDDIETLKEEMKTGSIFNKIYKNTLTQNKELIDLKDIYHNTEHIQFKVYLKDKIEENYRNLPTKENFSMEETIQDISNYINLNRIYKEEEIDEIISKFLDTDKENFLESIGYENEAKDLSKEEIQEMFSDFDKIFYDATNIEEKITKFSQLYNLDFSEFYAKNKFNIDSKISNMLISSDIGVSIRFLNFLEKEQILSKKEFLEENQEKINLFIQKKIDRYGNETIYDSVKDLLTLISKNDLLNKKYLNNYKDIVNILYLNVSQYSELKSYEDIKKKFNIDKSSLSDEDMNDIINNYIKYKGKTAYSLFRNIVELKIHFQINDLKLEFSNKETKEKFYVQILHSISYIGDYDGRRLIKELFNNGSLDLDEFKNKYKKELDIEISQITSLRDIKNLEGIISDQDFILIVEQRIQDALSQDKGNLELLYKILYDMEIIEEGYKVKFLRNNVDLINSNLENMISQYNSSNLIQDLKYWDVVEEGYANNFFERNKEKIEERMKNRFVSGYNIRYIESELDYWNNFDIDFKEVSLESNSDLVDQKLQERLLQSDILFDLMEDLKYWDGVKKGYAKNFFDTNEESINLKIVKSLEKDIFSNFTKILDYWDNIKPNFRKEFFINNKEEINEILSELLAKKEVYKLQNTIILLNKESFDKNYNVENKFLCTMVKKFNNNTEQFLEEYIVLKEENIITEKNQKIILELLDKFQSLDKRIVQGYLEVKNNNIEEIYIESLKLFADEMIKGGLTEEERADEKYQVILKYVYPNNTERYVDYKSTESCSDREKDIENFKKRETYPIYIVDQDNLRVKGKLDTKFIQKVSNPIEKLEQVENLKENYEQKVEQLMEKISEDEIDKTKLETIEEKIQAIFIISLISKKLYLQDELKDLFINYNFQEKEKYEQFRSKFQSEDNIKNKEYIELCQLSEFYTNEVHDNKNIIFSVENEELVKLSQRYLKEKAKSEKKSYIKSLKIQKKGLNEVFINKVKDKLDLEIIEKMEGETLEEEITKIIKEVEKEMGFLKESGNTNTIEEQKILYNMLRSQREQTISTLIDVVDKIKQEAQSIGLVRNIKLILEEKKGEEIEEEKVHKIIQRYLRITNQLENRTTSKKERTQKFYEELKTNSDLVEYGNLNLEETTLLKTSLGDINLEKYVDLYAKLERDEYDSSLINQAIKQEVGNVFSEDIKGLEKEINKFEKVEGDKVYKAKKINGYITKSKESGNARMVSGVCIAGDNPDKGEKNLWDMGNYFQLVLQRPEDKKCIGLILLHHFDEEGERILTASYNPSETYVQSVEPDVLFDQLTKTLIDFAKDNDFDKILISENSHIRTNRQGKFVDVMNERLKEFESKNPGKGKYVFKELRDTAYHISPYYMDNMDVIWSK